MTGNDGWLRRAQHEVDACDTAAVLVDRDGVSGWGGVETAAAMNRHAAVGGALPNVRATPIPTEDGKNEAAMRVTSKGQVTIPQHVRERAGLMPGTDVEFVLVEATEAGEAAAVEVRLRKGGPKGRRRTRGQKLVEVLRGRGRYGMSTDEVIRLMRGPAADDEVEVRERPTR